MMSDALHLHYDINAEDLDLAGHASILVRKRLKELGFSPEVLRKVSVTMYEAEINAVIHACGGTADIEITPERIVILIADRGPGIPDLKQAMTEGYSTASHHARALGFGAGMGLPNIKKYADDLKVESVLGKGTTLTIVVNIA